MFGRMRRMETVDAEPNLIPVMNLFVAMIPFLLLAVAFFQLGVIPATLPTHTENTSDVEPSRQAITVSIVINDEGFRITAMNQSLPEAELDSLARTVAKESGQYDFDGLSEALQALKQRYPASDTVILLPTERIPFADIIRVMDTARESRSAEGGQSPGRPLFPNIVMSRTV
jgi:biopolymer transport protein ExbD